MALDEMQEILIKEKLHVGRQSVVADVHKSILNEETVNHSYNL